MEKLKQYWLIILLIFIVMGGLFYWFEWLPYQGKKAEMRIKERCLNTARSAAVYTTKNSEKYKDADIVDRDKIQREITEKSYSNCLIENGVEK